MRIMLDPGHGGCWSGAVGEAGVPEKDITLAVTLQIGGLLSSLDHLVEYTRRDDSHFSRVLREDLQARCQAAIDFGANLLVSIHCNSFELPGPEGFEVWTNPEVDAADLLAAQMWYQFRDAHPDMRGRVDLSDGDPDKESPFWVLVHTPCPAVLFELAFISNQGDEARLLRPSWQTTSAGALATSIKEWA